MTQRALQRRPIAFLVLALLVGACGFWICMWLSGESRRGSHEPAYLRPLDPSRPVTSAGAGAATQESRAERSTGEKGPVLERSLIGRVLYADGAVPADCSLVIFPTSAGDGTERTLGIDAEGYFDSGPLTGQAYELRAYTPSALMFPAKPRIGIPGGKPVNIYLHRVVGCRTLVLDELTGSPLDISDAEVVLKNSSGSVLPRNEFDFTPSLLGWLSEADLLAIAGKELHLRLLGTDAEGHWMHDSSALLKIQRPGLLISETAVTLLPAREAVESAPRVLFIRPGMDQRRAFLAFRYEDGSAPAYPVMFHATQVTPSKGVVASGAIRMPHDRGELVYAKPGSLRLEIGPVFYRRTAEVMISEQDAQVVEVRMERGCDVLVGSGTREQPAPAYWIAVEGRSTSGVVVKWRRGSYSRDGVLRLNDLPEGTYDFSLQSFSGTIHKTTRSIAKGSLCEVWFVDRGTAESR